ncbi:hypothetical protein OESDEN_20182, partial [Oesophagostomum dentatum]
MWSFYENVKRYHKGPTPLLIIGNLHSLPKPYVIIMDLEGIKEAFVKKGDDFAGRTGLFPDTLFQYTKKSGIVFSDGDNWKEQRRTALHILRDFGMGRNLMEEQVLLSAQDFLAHLDSLENKEQLDMREPIQIFVANIINKLMYGYSYDYDNCSRLMRMAYALNDILHNMRSSKAVMLLQLMPSVLRLRVIGTMIRGKLDKMYSV